LLPEAADLSPTCPADLGVDKPAHGSKDGMQAKIEACCRPPRSRAEPGRAASSSLESCSLSPQSKRRGRRPAI